MSTHELELWQGRANVLAVIDDAGHNEAVTLGTLASQKVQRLEVIDQASYDEAALLGTILHVIEKKLDTEYWKPKCDLAFHQHRGLTQARADEVNPLRAAKVLAGQRTAQWEKEQERIRRAQQDRLRLEAERLQIAEAEKIAAELRRQNEEAALRAAERAKAELIDSGASAEEAAAKADTVLDAALATGEAEAQQVISEQMSRPVVAPAVQSSFQRAKGTSVRQPWGAELPTDLTDDEKILDWVRADLPNRRHYFKWIQSEFDSVAKKTEGKAVIPGVRFVQKEATSQFRR